MSDHYGFVVAPDGTCASIDISPELSVSYDILIADGYPPEKAAEILVKAERMHAAGELDKGVEDFARHMVKLRKGLRG